MGSHTWVQRRDPLQFRFWDSEPSKPFIKVGYC